MNSCSRVALPVIVALALTVFAPAAVQAQGPLTSGDPAGAVPTLASDLSGYAVAGPDGEALGHVADLMAGLRPSGEPGPSAGFGTRSAGANGAITGINRSGLGEDVGDIRLEYALTGHGGFLGLSQTLRPVPLAGVRIDLDNERFLVDFDRETLESAPDLDAALTTVAEDPAWDGIRLYWQSEEVPLPVDNGTGLVYRLSDLNGWQVLNLSGEQVAWIADLVVEPDADRPLTRARIRYAVLGFGGFLGLSEDLVAVPLSLMRIDPALQTFYLDADPTQLVNAPEFVPALLAGSGASDWDVDIAGYWGVED